MSARTDTDEATLREAVAAKHRAADALWAAEAAWRRERQARAWRRHRQPDALFAPLAEAQSRLLAASRDAAERVCRLLAARGQPATDGE